MCKNLNSAQQSFIFANVMQCKTNVIQNNAMCNNVNYLIILKNTSMDYSFERAFDQVPHGEAKAVKTEIMAILKIKSRPAWFNRLRGNIVPRVDEAKAIEAVFARYGITRVFEN